MIRKLSVFLVVPLVFALAALIGAGPALAAKGPIKIGLLTSKKGVLAKHGSDQMNALKVFREKFGDKVAGRDVQFFVEDNESKVALAVTRVRKLLTRNKVHIAMGGLFGSTGYAIAPLADRYKTPILIWSCPDDISKRKRKKYAVTYFSCSQPMHAFAHWVRTAMPNIKKVITIGPDYAFGYESTGGFQQVFEDMGGKVIQKMYMPINTVDYGPYIGKLRKDADALFLTLAAAQGLRLPKQLKEAGLANKYVILGNGTNTDEFVLDAQGDEVLGWISALIYSADIQTKDNQDFVKAFRKHAKKDPGYYAEGYYGGLRLIYKAIEVVNGNVEDKDKFFAALKNLKVASGMPAGPRASDGHGTFKMNVYVRMVMKDETGKKRNKVLAVIPNVSQFWTYKPDEFMKNPPYSRDYPPCKNCAK